MYQSTHQYSTTKKMLSDIHILYEYASFESYNDSIFTFGYTEDNNYHQFNVICDDMLLSEMMCSELIELKRITYFSHSIFIQYDLEPDHLLSENVWSMHDVNGLN